MAHAKPIADWMAERGVGLAQLFESTGVPKRVVEAIARGRYTPSPEQRRQLADALQVGVDQIAWGHTAQVEHIQGHGPQFGRSP